MKVSGESERGFEKAIPMCESFPLHRISVNTYSAHESGEMCVPVSEAAKILRNRHKVICNKWDNTANCPADHYWNRLWFLEERRAPLVHSSGIDHLWKGRLLCLKSTNWGDKWH